MPSLPAARFSGSLCSRDLILKLLHISWSIPSKLPCEIIFWCTKLPIPQFLDEFSNAEKKCFLHMTVTALFPVSPPTVYGSHDFLLFLMLCQNFLGDLFRKASAMASALHFCWDFRQALNAYWNLFYFLSWCQIEVHFWVYDCQSSTNMLFGQPCAFLSHPCSTQEHYAFVLDCYLTLHLLLVWVPLKE